MYSDAATLEDKIDSMTSAINGDYSSVVHWRWSHPGTAYPYLLWDALKRIIEEASLAECLTSPSHYIREYRKWYEENKIDV